MSRKSAPAQQLFVRLLAEGEFAFSRSPSEANTVLDPSRLKAALDRSLHSTDIVDEFLAQCRQMMEDPAAFRRMCQPSLLLKTK
jgi:hypothetical protein